MDKGVYFFLMRHRPWNGWSDHNAWVIHRKWISVRDPRWLHWEKRHQRTTCPHPAGKGWGEEHFSPQPLTQLQITLRWRWPAALNRDFPAQDPKALSTSRVSPTWQTYVAFTDKILNSLIINNNSYNLLSAYHTLGVMISDKNVVDPQNNSKW